MTYRIVRRAFSQYADIEIFEGGCLAASDRADELQRANRDGEYLVRKMDEPNQIFARRISPALTGSNPINRERTSNAAFPFSFEVIA